MTLISRQESFVQYLEKIKQTICVSGFLRPYFVVILFNTQFWQDLKK